MSLNRSYGESLLEEIRAQTDTVRRRASVSEGERPQKKPNL